MVGGDGGGKRTHSEWIHRGTKEEHRNNYKDLNVLNGNAMRKQWLFRQQTELNKINIKKVELFEQETELKKMQVELRHWLEMNIKTQQKQKRLNF